MYIYSAAELIYNHINNYFDSNWIVEPAVL